MSQPCSNRVPISCKVPREDTRKGKARDQVLSSIISLPTGGGGGKSKRQTGAIRDALFVAAIGRKRK